MTVNNHLLVAGPEAALTSFRERVRADGISTGAERARRVSRVIPTLTEALDERLLRYRVSTEADHLGQWLQDISRTYPGLVFELVWWHARESGALQLADGRVLRIDTSVGDDDPLELLSRWQIDEIDAVPTGQHEGYNPWVPTPVGSSERFKHYYATRTSVVDGVLARVRRGGRDG